MKIENEIIYQHYATWRIENSDLIEFVQTSESSIKLTFEFILPVVDFLYNELIDNKDYGDDEHGIFEFGFNYLVFKFDEIQYILDNFCNKDLKKLESIGKTINLMFSVIEFEQQILEGEFHNEEDLEKLIDLEKEIQYYIEKCENAPLELFQKVDEVSLEVFARSGQEFESIASIYAEIAESLGINE